MRKALTHRPEYEVRPLGDEQLRLLLHRSAIVDARSRALRHKALDNDELIGLCSSGTPIMRSGGGQPET
jgi:hypothetical protein